MNLNRLLYYITSNPSLYIHKYMHCILFNLSLFAMPLSLSRPHLGRVVSNYCWSNNISGDAGPSSAGPEHKSVRGLATESKLCFFFFS